MKKLLTALLLVGVCMLAPQKVEAAQTINKTGEATRLYNYNDLNNAAPIIDFNWEFNKESTEYVTDTYTVKVYVPVKSVLYVRGGVNAITDYAQYTDFIMNVYSDASLTNKVTEKLDFDLNTSNDSFLADTTVVPAGYYYVNLAGNNWYNFYSTPHKGRTTVKIGYMPYNEVFNVVSNSTTKKAKATVNHSMGSYVRMGMYREGSVSESKMFDSTVWMEYYNYSHSFSKVWDNKCKLMQSFPANLSFKKGGKYTFVFEDTFGTRVQKVVNIVSPDKKKPTVTGVKNKKVYTKAVKIKFKDTGSGIKYAKLNGKKIKSGKKVKKAGSYKLVVCDKAGNKTTIKFKIKKK